MGFYTDKSDKTFFPVVYVREDGVLERQLELLRQAGWKIIELSCEKFLKSSGSEEDAMIVFEAIEFPYEIPRLPDDWIHEYLEDLHWLDLSQGFFFVLKDYDVFFQDQEKTDYFMAKWTAKLLQTVDNDSRYRHSWSGYADYDPPHVLYGMEVSRNHLDQVLEFFEGRAIVVPEFDEDDPGAEYPVYVKNKEDTIRSWRGMTVDPEDTEGWKSSARTEKSSRPLRSKTIMGFYTNKLDKTFFPVVYVKEDDDVLERQLEFLRKQGWKIIEFSCSALVQARTENEYFKDLLGPIEYPYGMPDDPVNLIYEYMEDLHWLDLSKGVFVVLRDYDTLFRDDKGPEYLQAKWMAQILQSADNDLRYRHSWYGNGDYDPPHVLYGMEVSRNHLDQVLEYFEGRAIVIPEFDENNPGAEHPLYLKNKDEVLETWKHENS